jgi:hypothetical protein
MAQKTLIQAIYFLAETIMDKIVMTRLLLAPYNVTFAEKISIMNLSKNICIRMQDFGANV